MVEPDLHILDDPAAALGRVLAEAAHRGETIVLTGGTTSGTAYEHASALEPDWSAATAWWGDERCVPPDDEGSNYALAKRTLLDRLDRPARGASHPRRARSRAEAAAEYDDGPRRRPPGPDVTRPRARMRTSARCFPGRRSSPSARGSSRAVRRGSSRSSTG